MQHPHQPTPPSTHTPIKQQNHKSTLASTNTRIKLHPHQTTPASTTIRIKQHPHQLTPASTKTSSNNTRIKQHHHQPTPFLPTPIPTPINQSQGERCWQFTLTAHCPSPGKVATNWSRRCFSWVLSGRTLQQASERSVHPPPDPSSTRLLGQLSVHLPTDQNCHPARPGP